MLKHVYQCPCFFYTEPDSNCVTGFRKSNEIFPTSKAVTGSTIIMCHNMSALEIIT